MNTLRDDDRLRTLLDRLHAASEAQEAANADYLGGVGRRTTIGDDAEREVGRGFWRDKFVALDRDKAELTYQLCRARNATRVVEAGTSFGVSTLYLAAAVRDAGGGTVIATELEPEKAAVAGGHFGEAGLADVIDLRVGDLRQTLIGLDGPVDLLLLDIWIGLTVPVLELVGPLIPEGGIVLADNTITRRTEYGPMLGHLDAHGFTRTTLPYSGGFELAVRTG